jgi:hypothetical protein
MNREELIDKIKGLSHLAQTDRDKIVAWTQSLPNTNRVKPNNYCVGDVLMHPIFIHPYVLLKKEKDHWVCAMLTSDQDCAEILEACQSRFFPTSFFTKHLFTVTEPVGYFMSVYENKTHMYRIHKQLKEVFK